MHFAGKKRNNSIKGLVYFLHLEPYFLTVYYVMQYIPLFCEFSVVAVALLTYRRAAKV